ncbi:hypothetical protein CAL28_28360 [Bordetella genomosp. 11]|uniref:Uncharacterized protein n=1 Tax=Bordetella genomosp. 11 TaxID=1416808 RepID=A0A261UMC0_9BORD|nr:hypothetical protein CAL28_28360 [Bordetella genomosp. 11]
MEGDQLAIKGARQAGRDGDFVLHQVANRLKEGLWRFLRVLLKIGLRCPEQVPGRLTVGWVPTKLERAVLGQLIENMLSPVLHHASIGRWRRRGPDVALQGLDAQRPDQVSQKIEGRMKAGLGGWLRCVRTGVLKKFRPAHPDLFAQRGVALYRWLSQDARGQGIDRRLFGRIERTGTGRFDIPGGGLQ